MGAECGRPRRISRVHSCHHFVKFAPRTATRPPQGARRRTKTHHTRGAGTYRRCPLCERCGCIMGMAAVHPRIPYCGPPRGPDVELSCACRREQNKGSGHPHACHDNVRRWYGRRHCTPVCTQTYIHTVCRCWAPTGPTARPDRPSHHRQPPTHTATRTMRHMAPRRPRQPVQLALAAAAPLTEARRRGLVTVPARPTQRPLPAVSWGATPAAAIDHRAGTCVAYGGWQESVSACNAQGQNHCGSGRPAAATKRVGQLVHGRGSINRSAAPLSEGLARCLSLHADQERPAKGRPPTQDRGCHTVHQGCGVITGKKPKYRDPRQRARAGRRVGGLLPAQHGHRIDAARKPGGKKRAPGSYARRPAHCAAEISSRPPQPYGLSKAAVGTAQGHRTVIRACM